MNNVNLNENETKVLESLVLEMKNCTGGQFGFMGDANKLGFSKHEFAGYISSLQKKGVFEFIDTNSGTDYQGQFIVRKEYYGKF